MLLAIPLGILIGLVIGTVGGGGAILALPVLVYVLGEGVGPASTASLIVVAVAAAFGASALARSGRVCWRIAIAFSIPAAAASYFGAIGNAAVDPKLLVLAFVPVMVASGVAILSRAGSERGEVDAPCTNVSLLPTLGSGAAVGVMTGFFGVGGGFLIVPALTVVLGVHFHRAVATSLAIIFFVGVAALASHLATGTQPDWGLTVALAGSTAAGALLGAAAGQRLPQAGLARAFAIVVLAVAAFLLADTLLLGGPPVGG